MLEQGNAHADGAPFGHWFVGDLQRWSRDRKIDYGATLRHAQNIEIKWGLHPTGEQRTEWAACTTKRTLSVLVRGKFLLKFRQPHSREAVTELRLSREGDYAIWNDEVEHTWIVEEDAVILTVRWTEQPHQA